MASCRSEVLPLPIWTDVLAATAVPGGISETDGDCGPGGVFDVIKGDSLFLPAGTGAFRIEGTCSVLLTVK